MDKVKPPPAAPEEVFPEGVTMKLPNYINFQPNEHDNTNILTD